MKIRNGFVSNSSSSSFLVGFPDKLESADQLKKMIFGERKMFFYDWGSISTERLAEIIFNGMKPVEDLDATWEELNKYSDDYGEPDKISTIEELKEFKDAVWYVGSFEDKGAENAIEPFGEPFAGLPYSRFSHH